MGSPTLKAVGWDHERCIAPMRAAALAWRTLRPDVTVDWSVRPLEAFNDEPIEELAARFDLLVVDHPFAGTAAETGCLVPLDELVPGGTLAALAADAIGPSHASYAYAGRQWALAADAACQVGAVRDDLLERLGLRAPATWAGVQALAEAVPGRVAFPLYPTDAICSLLTLLGGVGSPAPAGTTFFREAGDGEWALGLLAGLRPFLHPESFGLNPPRALDRMRDTDEIVAIPLLFGYASYSRRHATIRFVDVPTFGPGPVGSLLGGAGLAVSSLCRRPEEAAEFAAWVCGAEAQRSVVFPAGGQPASRQVWLDPELDEAAGGFFSGTRASIETAQVRPREPWWPRFQEAAGETVARLLRDCAEPARCVEELERLYDRHRDLVQTRRR